MAAAAAAKHQEKTTARNQQAPFTSPQQDSGHSISSEGKGRK
jgi:hypothetical protein